MYIASRCSVHFAATRGGSRKLVREWRFVEGVAITIKKRFLKRIRGAITPLFSFLPRKNFKKNYEGWRSPDHLPLDPPLYAMMYVISICEWLCGRRVLIKELQSENVPNRLFTLSETTHKIYLPCKHSIPDRKVTVSKPL